MMAKETDYKAVAQQIIEVVGGPALCDKITPDCKKQGNH